MSIQHTSRTGKTYYLHRTTGKSGNLRYHFSTRPDGILADTLPSAFEIYENVQGQVFLRRKLPQIITDDELNLVKGALHRHAEECRYKIEAKKEVITVYEASNDFSDPERIALPWINQERLKQLAIRLANYMAVLRFCLADRERRLFRTERFCFRGAVDDWIDIGGPPRTLESAVRRFIPHLGKESIYELS